MKITATTQQPATFSVPKGLNRSSAPDLKPTRRKTTRNPRLARLKRSGSSGQRRSRPETPLLKWNTEVSVKSRRVGTEEEEEEEGEVVESIQKNRRRNRKSTAAVSARKLAAGLWRLQLAETGVGGGGGGGESRDRLGFQVRENQIVFLLHFLFG